MPEHADIAGLPGSVVTVDDGQPGGAKGQTLAIGDPEFGRLGIWRLNFSTLAIKGSGKKVVGKLAHPGISGL